jgi:hypothetical protein
VGSFCHDAGRRHVDPDLRGRGGIGARGRDTRGEAEAETAELKDETVILSGVGGSRSEAPTESKDPLPVCGEVGSKRSSHDTRQRGEDSLIGLCWDLQVWGPSTEFPFASRTETPLRMTDLGRDPQIAITRDI